MSVPLTGTIDVYPGGAYATHQPLTGQGGAKAFVDTTARNAFVAAFPLRCQRNQLAVLNDGSVWYQNTASPVGDDTDWTEVTSGGTGTVTDVSLVSANGFGGSVATSTTTPAITLTTSVTGLLKGDGTGVVAATAGTDYLTGIVTYAKIQNVAASSLLGNPTGSGAAPSEITLGSGLAFSGTTLTATGGTGTVTSISQGTGIACTPNPIVGTGTVALATIATLDLLANSTGGTAAPAGVTLSAYLDAVAGTGTSILARVSGTWTALALSDAQLILGTSVSAGVVAATMSGDATITDAGVVTVSKIGGTTITFPISAANGGTGHSSVSLGDTLYGGNSNTIQLLGGNATTTKKFLTQTGTGSAPNAPAWGTVAAGDLPTIPTLDLLANSTGGTAAPAGVSVSAYLDAAIGSAAGVLARNGSGGWGLLSPTDAQLILGTSASAGIIAATMSGDATITDAGVVTVSKIGGTAISFPLSVANGGTGSASGASSSHSFGVSGTPVLNAVTPPIFLDRAVTCDGLTIACGTAPSGGSLTVQIQTATDGVTWGSLASGAVSATTGAYSGTAACTTAITANTYVRGKFTAVNGAADVVAELFIRA